MGLIDKLRKVGGIVKDRVASAVGALRGVTVSGSRVTRGVRVAARSTRLLTPTGIAITAASFAPEIVRGARSVASFLTRAVSRGGAFVAGRRVVSGIAGGGAAGAAAGILAGRKSGQPTPVQSMASPSDLRPRGVRPTTTRKTVTRRKAPSGRKRKAPTRRTTRKRKPVRRRKRRTHSSPRHKGHKRVSFTTKDGRKVSFLSNPKARHR